MAKIKFFDDRMQSALLGGKMPKTKITPVSSAPTTPLGALDRLGRAGLSTYEKYLEKQKAEAGRKEAFDMLKAFTSGVNKPGKEIPGARITENDQEKADQIVHQKILQDYVSGNWAPGYGDLFVEPKEVENREKAVNDQLNEEKFHIQIDNEIQAITNNGESFNNWAYSIARQHGKNPNSALSVSKDKKQIDALIKDYGEASSKRSINATATTPGLLSLKDYNALKSTNEMRNLHRESLPNPDTTFGPDVVLKGMDAVNTINPKTSGGREMLAALMMKDWQRKEAEAVRDEERVYQKNLAEAKLRREKDLKGASGWEKTKKPVPGRDVPYSEAVAEQLIRIAKNKMRKKKPVPGRDVPYSAAVSKQLTEIAAAEAGSRAKAKESAKVDNISKMPMPSAVIKILDEHGSAISTAMGINVDFANITKQLEDNTFDPGLFSKMESSVRNYIGASTPESRAYGSYKTKLEKIRNDSLRLNKGMQTEGDATRAMNEIIANANDKEFVKLRLKELQVINRRAIELRQYQADSILKQFGRPPLKIPGFKKSAVNALPEGVTEADIVKTMKEHNMTRKQVLEKLRRLRNGG